MSAEQFSSTIEKLYTAAMDPSAWTEALYALEELTGSAGAVLGFVPKRPDDPGFNLAGHFTDEQCATYTKLYQPICPRTAFAMRNPGVEIVFDALLITESEMDRDPVYDWLGKHNLRYFIGSRLPDTELYVPVFGLQRSPQQGHVQQRDVELFALIKPHVSQAIMLADKLGTLTARWHLGSAILEELPHSIIALDELGYVVFTNKAAQELLRDGDGLRLRDSRLACVSELQQPSLEALIRRAAGPVEHGAGGWMRLRRGSERSPYAVFVTRLAPERLNITNARPAVLVMITDPYRPIEPDPIALRQLFGLTEAESRVAVAIASGHDILSASGSLGIAPETLRTHLKGIFRKMGVNRQRDIISALSWFQIHP